MGAPHFVIVPPWDDPEEDIDVGICHPQSCVAGWHNRMGLTYECGVQQEIDNCGLWEALSGSRGRFANPLPAGTYRVTHWVDRIVGPTWVEWDAGLCVEEMTPVVDTP